MNWTKEKPTEEGYYWLNENFPSCEIQIIYFDGEEVIRIGSDVGEHLSGEGFFNFEAPGAEWYGPLKMPEHLSNVDPDGLGVIETT